MCKSVPLSLCYLHGFVFYSHHIKVYQIDVQLLASAFSATTMVWCLAIYWQSRMKLTEWSKMKASCRLKIFKCCDERHWLYQYIDSVINRLVFMHAQVWSFNVSQPYFLMYLDFICMFIYNNMWSLQGVYTMVQQGAFSSLVVSYCVCVHVHFFQFPLTKSLNCHMHSHV